MNTDSIQQSFFGRNAATGKIAQTKVPPNGTKPSPNTTAVVVAEGPVVLLAEPHEMPQQADAAV
jgi:hypothetical protein